MTIRLFTLGLFTEPKLILTSLLLFQMYCSVW